MKGDKGGDPGGAVCFYGALCPLFQQKDKPGGDCRESRGGRAGQGLSFRFSFSLLSDKVST